jgi:hypothetical protein
MNQIPPDMPAAEEPVSMSDMLVKMQEETEMLERAMAGYSQLTNVVNYLHGKDVGRTPGMPILSFSASADGVHAMEVACDLAKVNPEYQLHVLTPMCSVHAGEMLEALEKISQVANIMLLDVKQAMGIVDTPQQPAANPNLMQSVHVDPVQEVAEAPVHDPNPAPAPASAGSVPPVTNA